jgi:hypothetical protein
LSNRDKHSVLNAAFAGPVGPFLIVRTAPGTIIAEQRQFPVRRLEHGTKLLWLRFDQRAANPDVKVDTKVSIGVTFTNTPVTLDVIRSAVARIIGDAAVFFP